MVNGFYPQNLDEALDLLSKHDVVPYAGGTDLMVQDKPNQTYLFVGKLPELRNISEDDEYVRIGAAVTFTEALASPLVPQFMKEAVSRIAAPAIRNAGTFGGNLGNGSAKADSVLVEYATGAKICVASVRGERVIPVEQFYKGDSNFEFFEVRPDEFALYYSQDYIPYDHYLDLDSGEVYLWGARRCLDCTSVGGTKDKPSYWPNDHI